MTHQFAQSLAPSIRELLVCDGASAAERLRECFDLDGKRPARILGRSCTVVKEHSVVVRELRSFDVTAVECPDPMVRRAPKLVASSETQSNDRRHAVLHHHQWGAGDDAITRLISRCTVCVHTNVFVLRREAPELAERD